MENWYRIQAALLAAIICGALAIHVLLQARSNRLFKRFGLFNLNLVAWFLVDALITSEALAPALNSSARIIVAGLMPASVVSFVVEFADDRTTIAQNTRRLMIALSIALVASAVVRWPPITDTRLALTFGSVALSFIVAGLVMYRRFTQLHSRIDRARLKVLLFAGGAVFSLSLFEYLPGTGYNPFANILTAIYMFFMFQVITLRRVLDLFEFMGRFAVLGGFAIVISVIYALLVGWWRYDLGLFLFNTTIATIVILILFDPLRSLVEAKLNQFVFREKFEFRRTAERLRLDLAHVIDVDQLVQLILDRMERSRRMTNASIYLVAEDGLAFQRAGFVGTEPTPTLDAVQARPFLTRLLDDKVVVREDLETERDQLVSRGIVEHESGALDATIQTMDELETGLALALASGEQVLGFLNVKDDRPSGTYTADEVRALAGLAAQTTVVIENSRLFDRMRERDRLAALGEMAAGLAHEIRNPLGSIKGATQLISGDGLENDQAYVAIIREEVDRLNSVVSQFLTYARPLKGQLGEVDINQVLERTLTLLTIDDQPGSATVDFVGAPNLPTIPSDPELIRQVTLNLARNAIEAMGESSGTLAISTALTWRRPTQSRSGNSDRVAYVRIRFVDEGPGIAPQVLERLFIPFFTTKPQGTGLGLAICQRIIQSLGGLIDVSSRLGHGTTVSVYLPVRTANPRNTAGL